MTYWLGDFGEVVPGQWLGVYGIKVGPVFQSNDWNDLGVLYYSRKLINRIATANFIS